MKKTVILILALISLSCSNPKNIKVDSKDASKYVEIICSELDNLTASNFKNEYKRILILSTVGKGRAVIIKKYSKQYKFLTLGDVLYNVVNYKKTK